MKKSGKNIEKSRKAVEPRPYTLQEAVPLLQKVKYAKFDETVEVTLRLGVDPALIIVPHLGRTARGGDSVASPASKQEATTSMR